MLPKIGYIRSNDRVERYIAEYINELVVEEGEERYLEERYFMGSRAWRNHL